MPPPPSAFAQVSKDDVFQVHAVRGHQVLDLACHLDLAVRKHDQVVGHPFQLGDHVRRQHDGDPSAATAASTESMKSCRASGSSAASGSSRTSRSGRLASAIAERELRLLAAGQLADLLIGLDAKAGEAAVGPRRSQREVQVRATCTMSGTGRSDQRRVLGDERDPPGRPATHAASRQHGTAPVVGVAGRRPGSAGCLPAPFGPTRGDHVPGRDLQRAACSARGPAVALAEPGALDDVHAIPFARSPLP